MALFDMPVIAEEQNHEFSIELDSVVFLLRLYFNTRDAFWYLDVRKEDGTAIYLGRRLTVEFPVMARIQDANKPAGEFALIDLRSQDIEAAFDTLGVDNPLIYLDAAETA